MGSLAYPPAEAGKDSMAPWHGQVLLWEPGTAQKAAESTTPPAQPFVALPAEQKHEEWQLCTPSSFLFFFFFSPIKPAQNFIQATFCLRDASALGCIFPEQAAAVPLSHFSTKTVCNRC